MQTYLLNNNIYYFKSTEELLVAVQQHLIEVLVF